MIKSAAIVKVKTLAPWKEVRLQKRKLKKAQMVERKATKQVHPSPIGRMIINPEIVEIPVEDSAPTREEMLQQADAIGLKVDKRWSDATLLKQIEEASCLTPNDNS
jgi:hypothetical protein